MAQAENETLLKIPEAARRLGVDPSTVRHWINAGVLEAILLPSIGQRQNHRVRESAVNALLGTLPASPD